MAVATLSMARGSSTAVCDGRSEQLCRAPSAPVPRSLTSAAHNGRWQAPRPTPGPLGHCTPPALHLRHAGALAPAALPGARELTDRLASEVPVNAEEVRSDLPAWISLVAYAALHFAAPKLTLTPDLLFSGLSWYQLAWSALGLLSNRFEFDRVGAVIAPGFLAARSLPAIASRISPTDTAAALFGYFLARDLPGPIWAWLGTLGYAIYAGWGPAWVVGAFGLGAVWKFADAARSGARPQLQQLLFAALAAWGLYSGQTSLMSLVIFGGQLLASAVS